jgi:hypothetical protein
MTFNTISYIIYAVITIYITVVVGYKCYKNGYHYVLSIFIEEEISLAINKILLLGYYLTNLGYVITIIGRWKEITSIYMMINELSFKIASIVFLLTGMHYMNIIVLSFWRKKSTIKSPLNKRV